ncbi:MAG: glycoside hydrolase [Acidobacteria bacterium]|nr:glycoside hydrolase [Acidobacteriota bacterium]
MRSSPGRVPFQRIAVGLIVLGLLAGAGCGRLTQKDIATDALDPNNRADTEPSIAVNPENTREITIVAFSENWNSMAGAPVWKSDDRGNTWRKVFQIVQPAAGQAGPNDQKIDFDADGRLYIAELASGGGLFDYVYRQPAGADDSLAPGMSYGDDQPHLAVDGYSASPRKGQLYSPWLDFSQPRQRSSVSWSADQGANMNSVGAGNNATFSNRTTRISITPNGKIYIVYKIREGTAGAPAGFENVHFTVNRSDDGGATWSGLGANGISVHGSPQVQTYFTTSFGNSAKGKVARARSSDAWIAADPANGDVYVAYVSRAASGFAQVYVARSTDEGATWTSSRVTGGTHNSAYPEIAVTKRGVVGVLYVDYDDSGAATLFRHRFARSFDRGQTWSDRILQSMDPGPLANAASGFLWGDYEGLTAAKNTFYGVFTGESSGRTTPQLDPIFFRQKSCRWYWISCWLETE